MNAVEFDRRYQDEGDPWAYCTSDYEHAKYEATLHACGPGPFADALELGGSIGVFSAMLAPHCARLTTIDFAPSAVQTARQRLAPYPRAEALLGEIPAAIPDGPFDLIVASEVLYYLENEALAETINKLEHVLAPGGRMVAVHWRPAGPERPFTAADVHSRLTQLPWLRTAEDGSTENYLLHAMVRR
jgi:cyclopropane fatty-acyl-phospholipid synthase-like methyltransferase